MSDSLLTIRHTDLDIEPCLETFGRIFRAFRQQDSLCVSFGVEGGEGRRWFVKHATAPSAVAALRRVQRLHQRVSHPALPRLQNVFETRDGFALVFDWVQGEVLYDYVTFAARGRRHDLADAFVRFRALPADEIIASLNVIYDVHRVLADAGYIAVDFYDGCIIYDFAARATHVCDLDYYREGPFVLEADRLPGSTRFMAPEEFVRGSLIDQKTNVYTLGKTALELLGDGTDSPAAWRGSPRLLEVVRRATHPDRARRYPSVADFFDDFRSVQA